MNMHNPDDLDRDQMLDGSSTPHSGSESRLARSLEAYVCKATMRLQLPMVLLSLATLPSAWFLLEIPKWIVNCALNEGLPPTLLGWDLSQVQLLFALSVSYLIVLSAGGALKFSANKLRGRINERIVRRLRLSILRTAHNHDQPTLKSSLASVAVQEVEPIGHFGSSLVVVPIVQGGALLVSIGFLLSQNVVLALSALLMLPLQVALLPRFQRRLNATVRERVLATRQLSSLMQQGGSPVEGGAVPLAEQMKVTRQLEDVRVRIHDLKSFIKGAYNYTSNLTPFFFFMVGGYLVIQDQLSLGALVAALAAYRELTPALRELFDFAQGWSDARARFAEVKSVLVAQSGTQPQARARAESGARQSRITRFASEPRLSPGVLGEIRS